MAESRRARHPSLIQGAFDLQMKVSNYFQVQAAYGKPVADGLVAALIARFMGAFGSDSTKAWARARRHEESIIAATAWDERLAQSGRQMLSPQRLAHSLIMRMMSEPVEIDGHRIVPSISATLRRQRKNYDSPEFLGDGYHVPPPGDEDWARGYRSDMAAVADFLQALDEGRFSLAMQPVRDFSSPGETIYNECLLRGLTADGSLFSGGRLVPAFERIGVVRLVDHRVVMAVLDRLQRYPGACLAVNISAQSAMADAWWWDAFARMGQRPDLGSRLIVEIRHVSACVPSQLRAFARRIAMAGGRLAFDRFGEDDLPQTLRCRERPDFIKLAPELVALAEQSRSAAREFQRIADVAREICRCVIATGIETAAQSRLAYDAGLRWQQGHFVQTPSTVRRPAPTGGSSARQAASRDRLAQSAREVQDV